MKVNKVPQDKCKTYSGHKRLLYAQDNDGQYTSVTSSGWSVEEQATLDAVNEYQRLAEEAKQKLARNEVSPLYYFMYHRRMDPQLLAQTTGQFLWQVKRHFKPTVFAKLDNTKLIRYCEALGVSIDDLRFSHVD